MKFNRILSRRSLAWLLAIVTVLGVVLPVAIPAIRAMDLAEYEQKTYFRNEASPMDGSPKDVTLTTGDPGHRETNTVISLDGTWDMTDKGGLSDLVAGRGWDSAIDATVPGSIYTALTDAGVIPDPYVGDNMKTAQNQSQKNWYLRRTFTYNGDGRAVELGFDGLCNVADIYLNGRKVASHEGMFGGPYVDVSGVIKQGENTLVVRLYPAKDYNSTVVVNSAYGWHYAKLWPLGIWQSVTVRDLPSVTLDSPFITTTDYKTGTVDLAIELDRQTAGAIDGQLTVTISPKNFDGKAYTFTETVKAGAVDSTTLRYRTRIPDFKLWWPNGYGEQDLYNLEVSFTAADGSISYTKSSFGIRQLDYKAMPSGESQSAYNRQIVINGVDIYMKGAGWCNIDAMLRVESEEYDRFLSLARDAGINYFRAWGGGLVETDEFYDLCDEYGLCVYQEWPCSWDSQKTQPASVLSETVILGAKRLRNRASLVVWGGGNEGVAAFDDQALNNIGKLTYETDGTRDFWRQDGGAGSTNITHDHIHWSGASPEQYLKTYSSLLNLNLTEYGVACMMNYESIRKFATAEELAEWPIDQKGTIAYHTATFNGMLGWTPSPHGYDIDTYNHYASMFIEVDSLRDLITGSQLAQAQADYLPAINARINAPYSTANVVYKLNDNYPGASWSIIDWYGSPKIAYYLMQDAYRPLMAAAKMDRYNTMDSTGGSTALTLPIYLLDDVKSLGTGTPWAITVTAYDEELNVVKSETFTGKGAQKTNQKVGDFTLTAAETAHTPLTLTVDLAVNGRYENRTYAYLNFESDPGCLFYLPRTTLAYSVSGNTVTIENTGNKPAVGVQLEVPATSDTTTLGDNYIWLNPGETVKIPVSNGAAIEGVTAFNLAVASDNVAPTTPADFTVESTDHDRITLSWTPSTDEGGLFGYNITVKADDGTTRTVFVRDNKTTATIDGLVETMGYTFTMEALDSNGNRSAATSPVLAATKADPTLPTVRTATVEADGSIKITFSTAMDKTRAEDVRHYCLAGGASVTSASLSADGLTVTLTTEGTTPGGVRTLVIANLTDIKHNRNNLGAVTLTLDPGLYLSVDFEPNDRGEVYTAGALQMPVIGAVKDIQLSAGGHSGRSLAAGNPAKIENLSYTFAEGQTVSLWIKGKAGSDFNVLLAKGPKTAGHFEFYTRSGQLYFYAPDLGDYDLGFNINTLPDGWSNLTFTWESGAITTYAAGEQVSSVAVRGAIKETTETLAIGSLADGTLAFAGATDTLRIYDRVLAAAEIAAAAKHQSAYADVAGDDVGKRGKTEYNLADRSTLRLWFNADEVSSGYHILFAKSAKSSQKHLELYTDNGALKLYAPEANGGQPTVFGVDMRAYMGSWHMLTLVRKDSQLYLYIDAELVSTVACHFDIPAGNDNCIYGRLVEGGMNYSGRIVAGDLLLDKALTADEISALYEEKLVKPNAVTGLAFAETLITLHLGETAPSGFKAEEGLAHTLTHMGDSVTLADDGTLTAVALGDSVLWAKSDDGSLIAAAVVRVLEELPPETEPPVTEPPVTEPPVTEPAPGTGAQTPAPTPTAPSTEVPDKGGCKSAIGLTTLLALTLGGLLLLRRKKNGEPS